MEKSNCSRCSNEFEKGAENRTMICQMCHNNLKSDIIIFQVFKWICFSIALAAFSLFIPVLAAKQSSPGYYVMPGKKPMSVSKAGLDAWKIAIPFVTVSFGLIGLYLGKKEDEKKSLYESYQNNDLPVK